MDTAASSDVPAVKRSKSGGGRAFYSRLEPFVEFIREQRRRRRTWKEIAEALRAEKGCAITFQGVHQFYRRYVMRQRRHHWERQSETGPVAGISEESPAGSPPLPVPSNYPLSSHQSLWACPVCRLRALWMEITDPRNERALEAWSLAAPPGEDIAWVQPALIECRRRREIRKRHAEHILTGEGSQES